MECKLGVAARPGQTGCCDAADCLDLSEQAICGGFRLGFSGPLHTFTALRVKLTRPDGYKKLIVPTANL
ncbi:hypothetical protein GCM10023156_51450 [Novipirellula rosea]|uniref:Uncharacterized protein n=1 Tax=Novipirellula rosea TaxID=1031540 RepID=A0ABP8NEY3_9BACT